MAIHICRDFPTLTTTMPSSSMYLSTIFLIGVLGYTQVGHTSFNVSSSLRLASGISGSINFGLTGSFSTVEIPSSSYVVSPSDVNRILVLKSSLFPRHNSGLFRIQSVVTASNRLNIDYRAAENPPPETGSLSWSVWPSENTIQGPTPYQINGGTPTGAAGYKSRFPYADKKIILRSPHTSSWQVRYCHESSTERTSYGVQESVAPGFGGDANGDFPSGSYDTSNIVEHLHGPMWFDVTVAAADPYQGSVVGLEPTNGVSNNDVVNAAVRFYAWGDDVSGSVCFLQRNVTAYADGWYSFGMAEEDAALPRRTSQRLFVFGRASANIMSVKWDNGVAANADFTGVAFGENLLRPISCVWPMYDYIGQTGGNGIKAETVAADNAMLESTELQKMDLWAGTLESGDVIDAPQNAIYEYEPRRMGSMPIARIGRTNFGTWSVSNDTNKAWFHATNGVFLPWSGPAVFA